MRRLKKRDVNGVNVRYWNPHIPWSTGPIGSRVAIRARPNNFGDLLGPIVVAEIVRQRKLKRGRGELLSVGSILHFARLGNTVWGTGINGKVSLPQKNLQSLDFRSVRGPKSRGRLLDLGVSVPEVYGDPALLLSTLFPQLGSWSQTPTIDLLVLPNLHDTSLVEAIRDRRELDPSATVVRPTAPVKFVLEQIARSKLVLTSSLHGQIIAESLGIPVVLAEGQVESDFKYSDHMLGTGRGEEVYRVPFTARRKELLDATLPSMTWEPRPLLDAFPEHLWRK